MRRRTWLLAAAVCFTFLLGGCSKEQKGQEEKAREEIFAVQEEQEAEQKEPAAPEILVEKAEKDWYDEESGLWLVHADYDRVSLEGDASGNLAKSIAEWSQENEAGILGTGEAAAQDAKEDAFMAGQVPEDSYRYSVYQQTKIMRADRRAVSLLQMNSYYLGGAHGNYVYESATFDAETGEQLFLEGLLTDAGAFRREATAYIQKSLEENYGDGLFPEYAATVEGMWSGEPTWYLDAAGITFVFDPYAVGPFAMGAAYATLPYTEFGGYIKGEYVENQGPGMARIPENVDILSEPLLRVTADVQEADSWVTVSVQLDDMVYEVGEFARIGEAYLLNLEDGRRFLLLDADYASDDFVTFLYEVTDTGLEEKSRLEGVTLRDGRIRQDGLTLSRHVDVLGSYGAWMEYRINKEGELEQTGEIFEIPENDSPWRVMTTVRALPVEMGKEAKFLEPGSRIRITGTDNEDTAYFMNEDTKEEGQISFVRGDGAGDEWSIFIDGVKDTEYFDMVPYAG